MTAAARITAEPTASVPVPHVNDLITENETIRRQLAAIALDLKSARARNSSLVASLRRAVEAPAIVGQSVIDKMLTLTYSNGRVLQLQPTAEYREDYTEFGTRWVEIPPAPDTPKAIVAEALAQIEAEDDATFDAPFIGGMEVLA